MHISDQLGREIFVSGPIRKIISLVPSQTELLADLGLEDEVIGITKFCIHPDKWFRSKIRVGGTKNPDLNLIRSLKPDLIIANKEENDKGHLEQLAGEFPVWISDVRNLGQALDMIHSLGSLTGKSDRAIEISNQVRSAFAEIIPGKPTCKAIYLIWNQPMMAVNSDTFIHDMMERAGFQNLTAEMPDRYPVITAEHISALKPEAILLSSEPYPFKENHISRFQAMAPDALIVLVDGEVFSWYGSRLIKSAQVIEKYRTKISS